MSNVPEKLKKELNERISVLQTLEAYLFEAMQINEIDVKTYYRVTSAIRQMIISYKVSQRFEKMFNEYRISLESLNEIQAMAKPYEVDPYNIEVKICIDIVRRMLTEYVNAVMKRKEHQMIEADVDKLLSAIAKVNKILGF